MKYSKWWIFYEVFPLDENFLTFTLYDSWKFLFILNRNVVRFGFKFKIYPSNYKLGLITSLKKNQIFRTFIEAKKRSETQTEFEIQLTSFLTTPVGNIIMKEENSSLMTKISKKSPFGIILNVNEGKTLPKSHKIQILNCDFLF